MAADAASPEKTPKPKSHGYSVNGIVERVEALRGHHIERLSELHAALAAAQSPRSAADMVPVLFRRELDLQQRFFAMGEAIAHLNHLWKTGRATRKVAADGAIHYAAA